MHALEFASLLCSRLCHDLISPVGSLYNGIELMADEPDPEMQARCLELLAQSAQQTANKLKFFRLAFGAAGGFGDQLDPREAQGALEGLFGSDGRVEIHWLVGNSLISKTAIKVLLNLAMIGGDALLRGGKLYVGCESNQGGTEIVIRAEGGRLLLDPELRSALEGQTQIDALTPRAAAAWLVHCLVEAEGGSLKVSMPEENMLLFGATLPQKS